MKMPETDEEWIDAFQFFETRRRLNIAKEIASLIAEINMTKLCEAQKGYFEANLMLIAGMLGSECLDEVKRRIRENESRN